MATSQQALLDQLANLSDEEQAAFRRYVSAAAPQPTIQNDLYQNLNNLSAAEKSAFERYVTAADARNKSQSVINSLPFNQGNRTNPVIDEYIAKVSGTDRQSAIERYVGEATTSRALSPIPTQKDQVLGQIRALSPEEQNAFERYVTTASRANISKQSDQLPVIAATQAGQIRALPADQIRVLQTNANKIVQEARPDSAVARWAEEINGGKRIAIDGLFGNQTRGFLDALRTDLGQPILTNDTVQAANYLGSQIKSSSFGDPYYRGFPNLAPSGGGLYKEERDRLANGALGIVANQLGYDGIRVTDVNESTAHSQIGDHPKGNGVDVAYAPNDSAGRIRESQLFEDLKQYTGPGKPLRIIINKGKGYMGGSEFPQDGHAAHVHIGWNDDWINQYGLTLVAPEASAGQVNRSQTGQPQSQSTAPTQSTSLNNNVDYNQPGNNPANLLEAMQSANYRLGVDKNTFDASNMKPVSASYYAEKDEGTGRVLQGQPVRYEASLTDDLKRFDVNKFTLASNELPGGTVVMVCGPTGNCAIAPVTDTGLGSDRQNWFDLSEGLFSYLVGGTDAGIIKAGQGLTYKILGTINNYGG